MSMDLEAALERMEAMRKACLDHRGTEQEGTPYVLEWAGEQHIGLRFEMVVKLHQDAS